MVLDILSSVFNPLTIELVLIASFTGIIFGALPGIGPTLAMALLMPFTFKLGATDALIFLGCLFGSTIYGGSVSAILINAPGTPGSAATALDGYAMAQQGRAGVALGIAATASALGGIVSMVVLMTVAPFLAMITLLFGPIDYFLLAIFGLSVIVVSSKGSVLKGFVMTGFGLMLAFVGMDLVYGVYRFSFGVTYLQDPIDFVPVLIGLFGLSSALELGLKGGTVSQVAAKAEGMFEGVKETLRHPKTLIRSILLGTGMGMMPGVGISAANFIAYNVTVQTSKDPDSFGKGNPEGVLAPEAANNAVEGGALIPTFALGIPGSGSCAIMLACMMMQGLEPGIRLFDRSGNIVYTAVVGIILGLIFTWVFGILGSGWFAKVTVVKNEVLVPLIVLLCLTGTYSLRNNIGDMVATAVFGFLGYLFKVKNYPTVPLILAMILGPLIEKNFLRAMIMSNGSLSIFYGSLTTIVLLILVVFAWSWPVYENFKAKKTEAVANN
ncbi:MAG TPA: tripartite tricarboxylate transporter permease [Clostridia bacterium]|nr:tripartite tricarboxylate transporter permease [Clostridia bacterium]